jgi:hypothetical protein
MHTFADSRSVFLGKVLLCGPLNNEFFSYFLVILLKNTIVIYLTLTNYPQQKSNVGLFTRYYLDP